MKQKIILLIAFVGLLGLGISCQSTGNKETETLRVLSLNLWHEGGQVDSGYHAIVEAIVQSEADIALLCEVRNNDFHKRLTDTLTERGYTYKSFETGKDVIILSKFPIKEVPEINSPALTKCIVSLNETTDAAVYAAHLDYTHYACYLPRGYDGITWKKMAEPMTNVDTILAQNLASKRDEAIALFVADAQQEIEKGHLVFLGGDFNEPSHLDWTEATKDLFDHNGTVVPWHNSLTLAENNYTDAFREKYPDPVTHPGFTWAAYNTDAELSDLAWTPEADDRERIDFVYYHPDERIHLADVSIMGPPGNIVYGKGVDDSTSKPLIQPVGIWPSDHKGVLATFNIQQQ